MNIYIDKQMEGRHIDKITTIGLYLFLIYFFMFWYTTRDQLWYKWSINKVFTIASFHLNASLLEKYLSPPEETVEEALQYLTDSHIAVKGILRRVWNFYLQITKNIIIISLIHFLRFKIYSFLYIVKKLFNNKTIIGIYFYNIAINIYNL